MLLSRWDVTWWSRRAPEWLGGLLRGPQTVLQRFWLPSMCAQEASPGRASRRRLESTFKSHVCGARLPEEIITLSSSAATSAVNFRGSWDAEPRARSPLPIAPVTVGSPTPSPPPDRSDNMTAIVVNELHKPIVRHRHRSSSLHTGYSGINLFGHWFWALQIVRHQRAQVSWAPLEVPREFSLVHRAAMGAGDMCQPTAEQLRLRPAASSGKHIPDGSTARRPSPPPWSVTTHRRHATDATSNCRTSEDSSDHPSHRRSFECPLSSTACEVTEHSARGELPTRALPAARARSHPQQLAARGAAAWQPGELPPVSHMTMQVSGK